jgi:hypothetical protein
MGPRLSMKCALGALRDFFRSLVSRAVHGPFTPGCRTSAHKKATPCSGVAKIQVLRGSLLLSLG